VQIVDGVVNPTTGVVDPSLNTDFTITLGNGTPPATVTVDLRPQDMTNIGTVISRINSQIASQLPGEGLNATDLVAQLSPGANGISLVQNSTFTGPVSVSALNNSPAAKQLGLLNGTYSQTTGTYQGTDTATVRPNNLMSALIDLQTALTNNDVNGIQLAANEIDSATGQITSTQGMVGGYEQRVNNALQAESTKSTMNSSVKSQLQDVDYASAASTFTLLQTQLQASLQTAAQMHSLSLLNFLTSTTG
jgi:flagellin-like hook-associated protein FlgL